LVQQEVGDLHVDGRQLDHLLGVVKRRRSKLAMSTSTRSRIHVLHVSRLKQGGSRARMAFLCAALAR
jgi:hypothetical protein